MKKISPEHQNFISKTIRHCLPDAKIYAFGSRIHGHAQQYSDMDIAIDVGETIDPNVLSKMEAYFAESDIPFKVDIVDYQNISREFQAIIRHDMEFW